MIRQVMLPALLHVQSTQRILFWSYLKRGRAVPEYKDSKVREVFIDKYRLIYRLPKDLVEIIGFVHGARDLAALLAKERGE
jgi:hypothetical protein